MVTSNTVEQSTDLNTHLRDVILPMMRAARESNFTADEINSEALRSINAMGINPLNKEPS